ncbi:MAG TPA: hypothetical protein VGK36_08975 [Candidatus Angelobacter sp.]
MDLTDAQKAIVELTDVQKTMVPGAREVLKQGLGYHIGADQFLLTLISVALEDSGNAREVAARKLGIAPSFISNVLAGRSLPRARKNRKAQQPEEKPEGKKTA